MPSSSIARSSSTWSADVVGQPGWSTTTPTWNRARTAGRPMMWSACGWLATTTSRRFTPSAASSVATCSSSGPPSTSIVAPAGCRHERRVALTHVEHPHGQVRRRPLRDRRGPHDARAASPRRRRRRAAGRPPARAERDGERHDRGRPEHEHRRSAAGRHVRDRRTSTDVRDELEERHRHLRREGREPARGAPTRCRPRPRSARAGARARRSARRRTFARSVTAGTSWKWKSRIGVTPSWAETRGRRRRARRERGITRANRSPSGVRERDHAGGRRHRELEPDLPHERRVERRARRRRRPTAPRRSNGAAPATRRRARASPSCRPA